MEVHESTELSFRALRKIQVFSGELPVKDAYRLNLVACSSKFGLFFTGTGTPSALITLSADTIRRFDAGGDQTRQEHVTDHGGISSPLPGPPVAVTISCDELILCVVCQVSSNLSGLLFDVRTLAQQAPAQPFLKIPISTGVKLCDISFNPVTPNCFAAVLSNGSAVMFTVKQDSDSFIVSSYPSDSKNGTASCICWSPKGKQLVLGHRDGKLTQHKPDWGLAKTMPGPNEVEKEMITGINVSGNLGVVDVQWVSTYVFLVAYQMAPGSEDNQISLALVHAPKAGNPVYNPFGDICYGVPHQRPFKYYMEALRDWGLVACGSATSIEIGVIGKLDPGHPDDQFKLFALDDTSRAEIPLDANDVEDFPCGMTMDFSSGEQIVIGETYLPPAPILLLYSSSGLLCPFHVVYNKPGLPNLTVPRVDVRSAGQPRKSLIPAPAQAQISMPTLPSAPPVPARTVAFGGPPLGQQNAQQTQAPSFFGGSSTSGSSLFGGLAANPQKPLASIPPPAFSVQPVPASVRLPAPTPSAPQVTQPTVQQKSQVVANGSVQAQQLQNLPVSKSDQEAKTKEALKCQAAINEEVGNFTKDLRKLQLECAKDDFRVASDAEKENQQRLFMELSKSAKSSEKIVSGIDDRIKDMQNELIEAFAIVEDADQLSFKFSDPRYRQLLEMRTPGVTIVRRIQNLKSTRQYLVDQLALARKALGAELQAESFFSARGTSRAGFDELLYVLQANRDPNTVVKLMQRQKDVLRNIALKLELLESRVKRLDPEYEGSGDAGSLKEVISTPKSLRSSATSSTPRNYQQGFTNAQEATETLCKGIPQLNRQKIEALWSSFEPLKTVAVRKVETVKVAGFGVSDGTEEDGKAPVGQTPAKSKPLVVEERARSDQATKPTANPFADLKRSVHFDVKPVVVAAEKVPPPPAYKSPTSVSPVSISKPMPGLASFPSGLTVTQVQRPTAQPTSAFASQPFGGVPTGPTSFFKPSPSTASATLQQTSSIFITPVKPTPAASAPPKVPPPVFSLPFAQPTTTSPSLSSSKAAPFSGQGFVLGSATSPSTSPSVPGKSEATVVTTTTASIFVGGSITAGKPLFGGKPAFDMSAPTTTVASKTSFGTAFGGSSFANVGFSGSIFGGSKVPNVEKKDDAGNKTESSKTISSPSATSLPSATETPTSADLVFPQTKSDDLTQSLTKSDGRSVQTTTKAVETRNDESLVSEDTEAESGTKSTSDATLVSSAESFGSITATKSDDMSSQGSSVASVFGGTPTKRPEATASTSSTSSPFGTAFGGTSKSPFGVSITPTTSSTPVGQAASTISGATTSAKPFAGFGSSITASPSSAPLFGGTAKAQPASTSVFGGFGAPTTAATTTTPSVFGGLSLGGGKSIFGGTSPFGLTNTDGEAKSAFGAGAPKTESGEAKSAFTFSADKLGFGGPPNVTVSSAGGSPFGSPSVFGGQAASPVAPAAAQQPTTPATSTSALGTFSSSFGSAFGLGGTPSAQNANKNVFAGGTPFGASSPGATSSIFGGASAPAGTTGTGSGGFGSSAFGGTAFGASSAKTPFGTTSGASVSPFGGGFSTPTAASGGFGSAAGPASGGGFSQPQAFGSLSTSPSSGFGGAPAFGGQPAFGSKPGFGTSPTFGGLGAGNASGGFGTAANAGSPMFGALAARQDVPTFGSLTGSGTTSGSTAFGGGAFGQAANQPTSAFGGAFGSPSPPPSTGFGGFGQPQVPQQPSAFGNNSSSSGASFSSWR